MKKRHGRRDQVLPASGPAMNRNPVTNRATNTESAP